VKFAPSFQTRIAGSLILLLVLAFAALYCLVKAATGDAMQSQLHEQLGVGGRVFDQLLDARRRQLHEAARLLAADSGLQAALARGDRARLRSVMAGHGARVNAEVLLLGGDGRLQVGTLAGLGEAAAARLAGQLRGQARGGPQVLLPVDGDLFQLVAAPLKAPQASARVVMGFPVDAAFVNRIRELTGLELTLVALEQGQPSVWISTLPAALQEALRREIMQQKVAGGRRWLEQGGRRYLGEWRILASGPGYRVLALLHKSPDPAEAAFAALDRYLLLVALLALCAALLVARLLARSLVQPLRELVRVTERIGQGDYQTPLTPRRSDELGRLAQAFQAMQEGIAEHERQLVHNALHDPLTGLPNRALALERLGSAITAGRPTALLYLGIANWRSLLDNVGAAGIDLVLQQLARRLQATLRPGDSLARLVSDEMLLLLEHCDNDSAVAAADRLQQLLLKPMHIGKQLIGLDCSIGIASYPADGLTPDDLLRRAAIAMQDAAQQPERLQVYQQGRDAAHQRQVGLVRDLQHAAERGELLLHYQPKLDLGEGRVSAAEALLRWNHPQFGMVAPGEFIPLAERTGSIQILTAWVIEEVLRQLHEWNGRGLALQVSLNISAEDLGSLELAERVAALLQRHAVAAEQLLFEITESAMMANPQRALEVLHRLRACGIRLAVDDFGTGYSSLAQLKRMPVQELKIDQSFIRELSEHGDDAVIVRSTIDMCHSLGLRVVAEGLEYQRNLDLLRLWRCDSVQGDLISRPLAAAAFEQWLRQPRPFLPAMPS
jgi:diguanylate cyclase (GGDEF)-like protein